MPFLSTERFSFISSEFPEDTFGVLHFSGIEGLSRCYRFDIQLVSDNANLELDKLIQNPAVFIIRREAGDIVFHGILSEFEQLHSFHEYTFFQAVLVPRMSWLSMTHHNMVFLDKSVPEFLSEVLEDGGLTSLDYTLKLQNEYPKLEYVCQYRESHLDFLHRWMEHQGFYYYFEQAADREKVIITDTKIAHSTMLEGATVKFSPPSGLDSSFMEEVIHKLSYKRELIPQSVRLKDYNYRRPSLEISGYAEVSEYGRGEDYLYGNHFQTPEEGRTLAVIRAEEHQCRERRYRGESSIPFLRPGYLIKVDGHDREDCNQTYLNLTVEHEGNQTGYLVSGLQKETLESEKEPYYRNRFTAIPSNVQFRPPLITPKARIFGTMNAWIDAAGSGKYAELDGQGRYKIKLPFDLSGRANGKGSAYVRMIQPYAGTDHGMHFPLHKGTEVLLTFIDGDPDRPIIAGAVPNPTQPSVIKDANQSMAAITTSGQNKIHFEDRSGKQRILMQTPQKNSWIRMGSPNDPAPTGDGRLPNLKPSTTTTTTTTSPPPTTTTTTTTPTTTTTTTTPTTTTTTTTPTTTTTTTTTPTTTTTTTTPTTTTTTTTTSATPAAVPPMEDVDEGNDGIRFRSDGKMWSEAMNLTGDYITGTPTDAPAVVQDMINTVRDYAPTNLQDWESGVHGAGTALSFQTMLDNAHVAVEAVDTVSLQYGNDYDFGGKWEYSLGNSYQEGHLLQGSTTGGTAGPVLNQQLDFDFLDPGGPGWTSWRTCSDSKNELKDKNDTASYGNWDAGNVWVEKKYNGCSYEYNHKAHSFEVKYKCSSHEISYGGRSIEEKYAGDTGKRTLYSTSEAGISEETTYDRNTGALMTYSTSASSGSGKAAFSMNYSNDTSASFNFSSSATFAFNASLDVKLQINLAFSFSLILAVAGDITITFAPAGDIKITNMKVEADFFGLEIKSEEAVKLQNRLLTLESGQATLANHTMSLGQKVTHLDNSAVKLDTVYTVHLMS